MELAKRFIIKGNFISAMWSGLFLLFLDFAKVTLVFCHPKEFQLPFLNRRPHERIDFSQILEFAKSVCCYC